MKARCAVDGCPSRPYKRLMCNAHYIRWRRHGDPTAGGPRLGQYATPELRLRALTRRDPESGCLTWTGGRNRTGYGTIRVRGRSIGVHRFAWELANGPIPDGMYVDHLCHNSRCCEPSHLRLATNEQNMANRSGASSNSQTGVRNVFPRDGRYIVRVRKGPKTYRGGTYDDLEQASHAAAALRREVFGEFADADTSRLLIDPTARDAVA